MKRSTYPINYSRRGNFILPVELHDIEAWVRQSEYRFGCKEGETRYQWWNWVEFVVPLRYLYDDYVKWKRRQPYDEWNPLCPGLMNPRQFSMALQQRLDMSLAGGWKKRLCKITRVCNRHGNGKRSMRVMRGVKHPDGYRVRYDRGRPAHDSDNSLED